MKLNPLMSLTTFSSARLNILSTADNHGNVQTVPLLAETIRVNKDDIFINSQDDSTMNILAVAGDWFINPSKKGFRTRSTLTNGDIQLKFLNKLIDYTKGLIGEKARFDTVFVSGNHDLDGGDKFLYRAMDTDNKKSLVTNVDVANSPELQELMEENPNITQRVVYEIPDSKNPDLKHKVLFLGVNIPCMKFYNPGLLHDLKYFDDTNKKDANIKRENLDGTIAAVKREVEEFKKQNPKGAVVLMSHTGAPISSMIRDEVPQINIILNGHDHKNLTSLKGKTNINSLGHDNELIKSLSVYFNDDGDIESTDMNTFYTKATVRDELSENPLTAYLKKVFKDDTKPIVHLKKLDGTVGELGYGDVIRYQNSYLANYLTSAVKRSVRKITSEPDVVIGIPSSIIRGGIRNDATNLELMKIFDGVSEDLSDVRIGKVAGEELVGLVVENVRDNLKSPKRNTIIQWSDLQVNRTLIGEILAGKSDKSYYDAIKIRTKANGNKFGAINPDSKYSIAINEKYLIKDDIEWPGKIRNRFVSLGKTYDELFRDYISSYDVNYELRITNKTKEDRIL